MAATTPTQISIEESTKKQDVELLEGISVKYSLVPFIVDVNTE